MSIFPTDTSSPTAPTNTILSEYAWDFVNDDFLIVNGKCGLVTGIDALQIWIYKALKTKKYRYMAYTQNFGNRLEALMGQGFSSAAVKSQVEGYLKECLLINSDITGITNINIDLSSGVINANFTVNTIYGGVSVNV